MRAVISDTSPINYLILIGEIEVLPLIFQTVVVPPTVLQELQHPKAPLEVRAWAQRPPKWIRSSAPQTLLTDLNLDAGDTEAISLANEETGALLIMDERKGRRVAATLGILVTGTLNVLEAADSKGLLNFAEALDKLRATTFRINEEILAGILERVRVRKR
jgi:predicted nucleic acid-binding protein